MCPVGCNMEGVYNVIKYDLIKDNPINTGM